MNCELHCGSDYQIIPNEHGFHMIGGGKDVLSAFIAHRLYLADLTLFYRSFTWRLVDYPA